MNDHIGRNQNAKTEKNSDCNKNSDDHSEGYPHYRELFQNDEPINEVPERILNCHRPLKPCGSCNNAKITTPQRISASVIAPPKAIFQRKLFMLLNNLAR